MPKADIPFVQLATRIPKDLHLRLKVHCVTMDTTVMHYVIEAIEEKLSRTRKPRARAK